MSTRAFCGVAPFLFREKTSGFEGKTQSETNKILDSSKNCKGSKGITISNSCGIAGNFVTMVEFKNKISIFRDLLDFSPCTGSASVNELLIWTLNDVFKRYPGIKPDISVSEIKDASMHKALKFFCDALKSLGDMWAAEEWRVKCKYDSSTKMELVALEQITLGMLEDVIKLARERLFDEMDEDEEMNQCSPPASHSYGKALFGSYSDNKITLSGSPSTPTSVLPEAWKSSCKGDKTSPYSPPLLLPFRVQAIEKLNPIDVKRLSFHMYPHAVAQDSKYFIQTRKAEREEEPGLEGRQHSEVKATGIDKGGDQDYEMFDGMEKIDKGNQEFEMKVDTRKIARLGLLGKTEDHGRHWIGIPDIKPPSTPDASAKQKMDVVLPPPSLPKLRSNVAEPVTPHLPLQPPSMPNDEVIFQMPVPPTANEVISMTLSPPPLSPQPLPVPSPKLSAKFSLAPPPPPPPPLLSSPMLSAQFSPAPPPPPMSPTMSPPPPMTPRNLAAPLPPPPPPPPSVTSENIALAPPPPPPPMVLRNGAPPPPPPPMGGSKGMVPSPPPLMPMSNPGAPPPPPGLAGAKNLRPKRATTKLKRSSQIGNLYRLLKGKVEGSNLDGKLSGRKGKVGAASGGKQGMADALAEMTKRSAYFQQIEEDVKNHATTIKEMKAAISSFQTSDMPELLKFHKYVESHLEKLTDETQVLARFEDFPSKKLEAIRMAAALYSKLDSVANTLQNWPIVSPVGQLLDKAESYFNKMKGEMDALERTKDEESKKFKAQKINFDFGILVRIKELMVDISSSCMELVLKEKRDARAKENGRSEGKKNGSAKMLWRAFQFAFRVYSFAGGHDDRADKLTRELAQEIETDPHN